MKRLMLADPGVIMVTVDLSQAENRVVAYVANEQKMIKTFEEGMDVHSMTASLIFGVPYDKVSDEEGSCRLGGGKFSQRFWAKKANHGLNYGLTSSGFALLYELSENDGRVVVESYHRVYPGIRQWHATIRDSINKDRRLTNCVGRTRTFVERWGEDLFKEAYSFIPQSTVADILNDRGVVYIYENAGPRGDFHYVDLINQVHDSLVFQYPIREGIVSLAHVLYEIKKSLESPIKWGVRTFSIPVEIKVGLNLKDMTDVTPTVDKNILGCLKENEEVRKLYGLPTSSI